jgi:hypothetical protein
MILILLFSGTKNSFSLLKLYDQEEEKTKQTDTRHLLAFDSQGTPKKIRFTKLIRHLRVHFTFSHLLFPPSLFLFWVYD